MLVVGKCLNNGYYPMDMEVVLLQFSNGPKILDPFKAKIFFLHKNM